MDIGGFSLKFLAACEQNYKQLCWLVGLLVRQSVSRSVADYSEQATYGVWPCLKREVWHIVCMGHRKTFRLSFLRIFAHEHKEFTFQISGIIKQLFMR